MDTSKYAGSTFLKFEHVADAPRREVIVAGSHGGFERLLLTFESGDQLSLNVTNVKALHKAYGTMSEDWIGCEVELFAGETLYQGKKTNSVLLRTITPAKPISKRTPPAPEPKKAAPHDPMNDEIPF